MVRISDVGLRVDGGKRAFTVEVLVPEDRLREFVLDFAREYGSAATADQPQKTQENAKGKQGTAEGAKGAEVDARVRAAFGGGGVGAELVLGGPGEDEFDPAFGTAPRASVEEVEARDRDQLVNLSQGSKDEIIKLWVEGAMEPARIALRPFKTRGGGFSHFVTERVVRMVIEEGKANGSIASSIAGVDELHDPERDFRDEPVTNVVPVGSVSGEGAWDLTEEAKAAIRKAHVEDKRVARSLARLEWPCTDGVRRIVTEATVRSATGTGNEVEGRKSKVEGNNGGTAEGAEDAKAGASAAGAGERVVAV